MAKETKKIKLGVRIALSILGLVIVFSLLNMKEPIPLDPIEGGWDISEQVKAEGFDIYLGEEDDFDFSNPAIQQKAKEIKQSTSTPREAIETTMKFVVNRVKYNSAVSVSYCHDEKASDALELGMGDCVSMTRLNVALLRAMGIPARSVGGCLASFRRCAPLFSVIPGEQIKTVALTEDDFKKRGFLHEWLEVWEPQGGWIAVEATSGQAFDRECPMFLKFSYDSNKINRCTINSRSFWEQCLAY